MYSRDFIFVVDYHHPQKKKKIVIFNTFPKTEISKFAPKTEHGARYKMFLIANTINN